MGVCYSLDFFFSGIWGLLELLLLVLLFALLEMCVHTLHAGCYVYRLASSEPCGGECWSAWLLLARSTTFVIPLLHWVLGVEAALGFGHLHTAYIYPFIDCHSVTGMG